MQYRIKVIEYESGRKEYVPQVSITDNEWIDISIPWSNEELLDTVIYLHKSNNDKKPVKSVTYKPVQP